MNLYYKLINKGQPIYFVQANVEAGSSGTVHGNHVFMSYAYKVWKEDRDGVAIIKDRDGEHINTLLVSRQEIENFKWVKLQANPA